MNRTKLREQLRAYFMDHRSEMLSDTARLVAINSIKAEAKPGMPFGEGAAKCLHEAMEMMAGYGLAVQNYDNYVITGDYGEGERQLDILAHLDVVPVSEDWTVTEPFVMKEVDGRIYGRGTADDKGPAICALYAIRAIRELDLPMSKSVRLILGSDEECGSSDIAYYFEREKSAPMTFSPDASYPVICVEKGMLRKVFKADVTDMSEAGDAKVLSITAGTATNIVPGKAYAKVTGLSEAVIAEAAQTIEDADGVKIRITSGENDVMAIMVEGASAHASRPHEGVNALTALVDLLSKLPLADCPSTKQIRALGKLFPHGIYHGEGLGIDLQDEIAGFTTVSFNILNMDEKEICGKFDCRASLAADDENTTAASEKVLKEAGFEVSADTMEPPHVVDPSSELVQKLMGIYEEVTGRHEKPLAIGGGTYVHEIENGVAFGCGFAEVDNRMHGDDEFMEIDAMLISCEIFALAILDLCR